MMDHSQKSIIVNGIKWSTISQFGRLGAQFITTLILTRLLSPSDFGLVGMAMVVIGFIDIFKDLGTSAAVIQRKNPSTELLSSMFWVNVGFGLLAMIILFGGASIGSILFREPRIAPLLRMLSITFFISGLSILQKTLLQKKLRFNILAKIELIAIICGAAVGIVMAISGQGPWSLVYQTLTVNTVTTALLWIYSSWRPAWEFHWSEVKTIIKYSLNLTGFNIFNYFSRNFDYWLIGCFLGSQHLGYYTLAYRILLFPVRNISSVIGRVMFPFYSKIQSNNQLIAHAYLKISGLIAFIVFPMMFGMMGVAKHFVLTVLGPEWQDVVILIILFSPVAMLQSLTTMNGTIYGSKGATDKQLHVGICFSTIISVSFVVGLHWGIIGVATAYVVVSVCLLYPSLAIPLRLIELNVLHLLCSVWKPFVNSCVMLVVLLTFNWILPDDLPNGIVLLLSIVLGVTAYLIACMMNNMALLCELLNTIPPNLKTQKN